MGLLGIIWKIVAITFLAIIGLGAYLYFSDYEAKATVTEHGEDAGGTFVVIRPKLVPFDHKEYLDRETWNVVCKGYAVQFKLKSAEYRVFDATNDLIYDSATGEKNLVGAAKCGISHGGLPL